MSKIKKWEIKKLTKKISYAKAANLVLKNRLRGILKSIDKFLADSSEENLHSMRISIRRLRYNMEIFTSCFERENYLIFYDKMVDIQNKTGEVRDLDVLYTNISRLKGTREPDTIKEIDEIIMIKRYNLKTELDADLKEFRKSDILKDFLKLLT